MTSNLIHEIAATAIRRGDECGVTVLGFGGPDMTISYEGLLQRSAWLRQKIPTSLQPVTVIIAANSPLPTILAFCAALQSGARPLVLPGPKALGGTGPFLERLQRTLARFPGQAVLALEDGLLTADVRLPDVATVPLPLDIAEYGVDADIAPALEVNGDDIAFLQMTSASTGESKLVAVSHANACANLTAMGSALDIGPTDRMASWLPLYHDMGLVGTTLMSFFLGIPLVMMKPTEFVMRPHRWIQALSKFRCTITAAPNFGYDYAQRLVADRDIEGCDLSSLRHAVIGAEPIRLATLHAFAERFAGHGFRADMYTPSYGMAESTLGTSMVRGGSAPRYLLVDPAHTAAGKPVRVLGSGEVGTQMPPAEGSIGVAAFSLGRSIPGVEIMLLDDNNSPIPGERRLGEIAVRGPSVSVGYLDPATGRAEPFPNGVHRTGDLGFIDDSDVFILDRRKHVIIRQGQNFLASLLEERSAHIIGRPVHETILLDRDIHDPESDITLIVENVSPNEQELSTRQLAELRELDLPVDVVAFARRRVIPRTTSGKKRYEQTRQLLSADDARFDLVLRLPVFGVPQ